MTHPILAAAFAAALLTTPAAAQIIQIPCMPLSGMIGLLGTDWQEVEHARGLDDRGFVIQVYVAQDGSFTIVTVDPDGTACPWVVGTNWSQLAEGEVF